MRDLAVLPTERRNVFIRKAKNLIEREGRKRGPWRKTNRKGLICSDKWGGGESAV